jgi:transcriptional regulator with XRE-family HTH domain
MLNTPKLTRHFAANLTALREDRGLNKSGLARELFGTEIDKRGYTVAKNRDRITAWESGKATPTKENIKLVADYFGIDPVDLAPDIAGRQSHTTVATAIQVRVSDASPDRAHVQLDVVLPIQTAFEIANVVARAPKLGDLPEKRDPVADAAAQVEHDEAQVADWGQVLDLLRRVRAVRREGQDWDSIPDGVICGMIEQYEAALASQKAMAGEMGRAANRPTHEGPTTMQFVRK